MPASLRKESGHAMSKEKNPSCQFSCYEAEALHSEVRHHENLVTIASCTVLHIGFRVILRLKHQNLHFQGRANMSANAVEIAPSTADFKSLEEKILRT